jgi:hypothetical protein
MAYEDEFASDPKGFMDHVFIPMFPASYKIGGSALTAESGEFTVRVIELANSRVVNPRTRGPKVFHMSLDVSGQEEDSILKIYWIPYKPNDFRVGILSHSNRYMFTAAMNGCTLGFGSQPGDGTCLVTHANNIEIGNEQGQDAQVAAQLGQIRGFFDGVDKFKVLEPLGYRKDSGGDLSWTACNFGISDGSNWTFWTAKYRKRNDKSASRDFFHGSPVTKVVPIPLAL